MAAIKIRKTVGKKGHNAVDDVKKIQELLNKHKSAGGYAALKVDMDCGKKTIDAIAAFQGKAMGMGKPDGRVDPGGATLKALNSGAGSVTPTSGGGGGGGGGSGGGSSGGTKTKPSSGGGGASKSKSSGKESRAELEERLAAATAAVEQTSYSIAVHEGFQARLDGAIETLDASQKMTEARFEIIIQVFTEATEDQRAKDLAEIARTADDVHRALAAVEKDGKPLDGVTVDKTLAANFKALNKLLADAKTAKVIDRVKEGRTKIERAYTLAFAALKIMRTGNIPIILALKAKRALHQKAADDAAKELKKLKKA